MRQGRSATTQLVAKQWAAPESLVIPPEHESYVGQRMEFFRAEPKFVLPTPKDVAEALLESVTDTSNRFRWVVGVDQAERFHMRYEASEK